MEWVGGVQMNNDLKKIFAERIATGLTRKTITTPSRWSEKYRIMGGESFPGPWSFKYFPWTKEMHDSKAVKNIGQKAAQLGFTETVLNIVFFKMDVEGADCLYILPSKTPDATDFSASRFGAALELSPHIRGMYSDVNNIGHKRSSSCNLYIRGSQSKSGLRSIPVSFLVIDEMSIMNSDNISLAMERVSGQLEKQIWCISTPTIDNENINKEYNLSTKEHFHYKCPACSRWTELIFPDCVEIIGEDAADPRVKESFYKCKECKVKIPYNLSESVRQNADVKAAWFEKSMWIPSHADRDVRGFWIPQLYSMTVSPGEFVTSYFKGMTSAADETEFFNSKLGMTHAVSGARVDDHQIDKVKRSHKNGDEIPENGCITMGIDVGNTCHYEICQWYFPKEWTADHPERAICKVIKQGKTLKDIDFSQLDELMNKYNVQQCVIDSQPERRAAITFANRFYGRVKLCFYAKGISGKTINVQKDEIDHLITVDRTSWMDLSLGRFHNGTIRIPLDTDLEYKEHIKAPVRVYRKDKDGNQTGSYESGTKPDHYAHARNYAEIALPFVVSRGKSHNMSKVL